MLCLKLSLLLLYLRIFAPDKVTRYLIYFGMTICIVAYTVLMFLNIFSNVDTVIAANKSLGAVNFSSDVYILCVPITAISKLQLSMKKKIGVMFVFMTGFMYVVSCFRREYLASLTFSQRLCVECRRSCIPMSGSSNRSGCYVPSGRYHPSHVRTLHVVNLGQLSQNKPLTLRSTIEEEVGLMCTCMPFFPAIVKNSPTLQTCIHSVASLGSIWTLTSGRHGSTTDGKRTYQKHVSSNGSIEDGLELQGRERFTEVVLQPESPRKTPRMELGAFEGDERPKSSYTKL